MLDLDLMDVPEDYPAGKIRKLEPDITYLKKPLLFEQIKDIFPQATTAKEIKAGRRAL